MVSRLVRSGYQQHEAEGEVEHLRGMQLLHFEFIRNDVSEQSLLFLSPDTPREQLVTFARDCFFKGWSIRDIAAHTALSKSTIHRLLAQPKLPQEQQEQPQEQQQEDNQQEKKQKSVPSTCSHPQVSSPGHIASQEEVIKNCDIGGVDSSVAVDIGTETETLVAIE